MQHYSCDYCGKELFPHADARYKLRMEVRMVCEGVELTDADLARNDQDPVDAMEDWLAESDVGFDETTEIPLPLAPMLRTYDLCVGCYRSILNDPLGLDRAPRLLTRDD